ncbi:MAG: ligase-associated DNA damage response endonuclease PdeM [Alphaproteobacteria bacterium]|nr:ligase-associated DNA damage response endonuclease PdeM [Alphaproteobacteria bacterium]
MTAAAFDFHGAGLLADASGALYWPAKETLAVADLHLEKGSAFAANGTLLPPYDSRETLRRLQAVLRRHRPRRVICLGDSFHDTDAAGRLPAEDAATLCRLTKAHEWIWITGNHDPDAPADLGGIAAREFRADRLVFRHEAAAHAAGEVSGHFHPKASVPARGRAVGGRCFVTDGDRLILPAFGAYAGGLDVRDPAIEELLGSEYTVLILGRARVHAFRRSRMLRVEAPRLL